MRHFEEQLQDLLQKVVVMGSGAQGGTSQFIQDLYKGVLPINEIAKSVGLDLPSYLGKSNEVPPVPKVDLPVPKVDVSKKA